MAKKSNNRRQIKSRRVKDRTAITVYMEGELLLKVDELRAGEVRSRGNMVHEIIRRFFTKLEQAIADANFARNATSGQ